MHKKGSNLKNCDYKVVELRKMASEKGVKNYSRMRKDELCKVLEIASEKIEKKIPKKYQNCTSKMQEVSLTLTIESIEVERSNGLITVTAGKMRNKKVENQISFTFKDPITAHNSKKAEKFSEAVTDKSAHFEFEGGSIKYDYKTSTATFTLGQCVYRLINTLAPETLREVLSDLFIEEDED